MSDAPSKISVRKATRTDLDTVIQFNAALAWESEGRSLDLVRLRTGVEAVFNGGGRGFYLLAEVDGQVVGTDRVRDDHEDVPPRDRTLAARGQKKQSEQEGGRRLHDAAM